ncbi:MAG: glycosyltransferase family 2 protein, partial [Muribaculaceae bacterium]|nr:glycosyltransferase family 2 protein [Muribaculaceae bacterium]
TSLRLAIGRWIAFLVSDDLWSPDKLERQIGFMVSNAYHFSYTEYEEIDEEDCPLGVKVSGPRYVNKLGMFSYCWPGCLTVMYDREKIGLIQIPNIKKNNDYAMWLKAIKKADCHLLKENLAKYRKRRGSISSGSYTSLIKWHYRLFREVEGSSKPLAALLTVNNLFWGVIKKLFYVRKGGG